MTTTTIPLIQQSDPPNIGYLLTVSNDANLNISNGITIKS